MEEKCPCIDCVVLAICTARIHRFKNYNYYILLRRKCSLYKEYSTILEPTEKQKLITDKVFGVNNGR